MADQILNCDGTDEIHAVDWSNVVGDKTISDGGFFGDLLQVARVHLEDAKTRGELREQDAGVAYGTAIMESMKEAIRFELNEGKSQLELCYLQAQIDKLVCDCTNDTCRAEAECALTNAKTLQVQEETLLVTEKIESEEKNNMDDGMIDQQIDEMIAKVEISKTQVALDQAKAIAEVDKVMGYEYTLDVDGNIVVGDDAGDGKLDAEVEKIFAEKDLIVEQDGEIPKESLRRDCTTTSQCAVDAQQIEKLICDCTNDTTMTDSKVSLNAAQENKLACECCNDSKRTEGQLVKWECDCDNAATLAEADVALKGTQGALYTRQAAGFDDNANQKLYESQLSAWSMVFQDTEMESVTPSIYNNQICESYDRIRTRLGAGAAQGDDCKTCPVDEDTGAPVCS